MRMTPRVLSVALAAAALVSCDAPTRAPSIGSISPRFVLVRDTLSSALLVQLTAMRASITPVGSSTVAGFKDLVQSGPGGSWSGEIPGVTPGQYTLTVEGTVGGAIQHYARSQNPITVVAGPATAVPMALTPVVPTVPTFTLADTTNFSRTVTLGTGFTLATGWEYQVASSNTFPGAPIVPVTGSTFTVTVPDVGTWFIRARPILPFKIASEVIWSDPQSFVVTPSTGGRTPGNAIDPGLLNGVPDTIVDRNLTGALTEGWYLIPNVRVGDSLFVTTRARSLTPPSPLNTVIALFTASTTAGTPISTNDNISGTNFDSRDSIRATVAEDHLVRVRGAGATTEQIGHYDVIIELRRLPAAPVGLSAIATSATAARITWTDAADNETSYRIERCLGTACSNFAELTPGAANAVSFDDPGLTTGATYRYQVRARNAIGNSVYAGPVSVTLVGPTAPAIVSATTMSGSRIDLVWSDLSDNETGFEIQRCDLASCPNDAAFTFSTSVPAGQTSFSNTGLAVDGTYTYRVRATNNVAPSSFSGTASANTLRPAAPSTLSATTMSANRIDLTWNDLASTETGYSIERCAGQGCSSFAEVGTGTVDAQSYSDMTAVPETFYSYRVRATNIAGGSNPSNTALANTRAPGVPGSLAATVVSDTRVDLSWADTTAAETGFQVERCEGTTCTVFGAPIGVAAGGTGYTDNAVVVGTSYRYRVRATGVAGNSAEAGPVLASILLPTAPNTLAASAASGTQVNLSWVDASDNETTFRLERCAGAACTNFVEVGFVTAGTAAYNDQGVTAENDYRYQVRARNAVGNSVYSSIAVASTRSAAAPAALAASQVSATRIDLAWTDNASNETGFRIERCTGAGCSNFAAVDSVAANVVTYQNSGIAAGASYTYRVRALNSVAASTPSNTATATTSAPSAPTGLSSLTVSATRIDVSWTDASSDEQGFRVERCQTAGCSTFTEIAVTAAGATTYSDIGRTPGTDYRYRIRAFNVVDASAYVGPIAADTRPPQTPANLNAATVSGGRIDLDWTDNSTNELSFTIERCAGAGCTFATLATVAAGTSAYSDLTVTVDETYSYRLFATNNAGVSAVSATADANTLLPVAPSTLTATTLSATSVQLNWTNNALDANGFIVERCTGGGCGVFAVIDSTAGAVTVLTDLTVAGGNLYTYQVRARNIAGRSLPSASIDASTIVPNAPSTLVAETRSDTRIDLSWVDGSSDESGFYIDRCTGAGCSSFATVDSLTADAIAYVNLGLTPGLTYGYRIRAFNAAGASTPSNTASASTNLPAIPTNLAAVAQTGTDVALTWTDNASDEDGYSIERCTGAGCTSFVEIDQTTSNAAAYSDVSVAAGFSYVYRIRAFSGAGNSDYSNTAATSTALPNAPSGLLAEATSTTSIELSWTDASDNESRFVIERCTGAACGGFAPIDSVSVSTATFVDLTAAAGTSYRYRVYAANALGASGPSNIADASTVLPAAPSNLNASTISSSQIDLTWDDNAANETAYVLERCTGVACVDFARVDSLAANTVSYSDIGLTPNLSYRYRLSARNGAGASAYTAIVDATTNVPADPSGLAAIASSPSSITIDWTDNSDNETDFVIQRCPNVSCLDGDFSDLSVVGANVTTYVDGSVTLGDTATYRVKAVNLNGTSRYSNNAFASVSTPLPADGFTATNTTANRIALAWTDGANNETGYELERCTGAGCSGFAPIATLNPGATAYTDSTTVLDETYSYRVRAFNFVGSSTYSVVGTANTIRPLAPAGLTATTISATQVDLAWSDLSNNEEGFSIERCAGPGCVNFTEVANVAPNGSGYNDLSVSVGLVYTYRLRAYNTAGQSAYIGPVAASTLLPADPTALSAVVSAPTEITLDWTDNATNENGYRIERCSGSGCSAYVQIAQIAANLSQYVDAGLNGNTFYRYRLRAFNSAGTSAYTAVVSPNTFAPAPPTALAATTVFGNRVDLSWTDAASNESGFRIERCTGAGCSAFAEVAVVGPNATSHADSTLSLGTSYRFRIRAYNGVANSAYTTAVDGNTNVPLAPSALAAAAQSTTRIDLAWTDNGTDETGYRIERCAGVACADFALLTTLPANSTSHSDTPIAAATSYTYRVRATSQGSSAPSNAATATTILPAAPSSLAALAVAADRVDLSWADNADNEYGTIIERCDGAACVDFVEVDTAAADAIAFSETGLTGNVIHRYRIRTFNGAGPSAYSSVAEATTNVPGIPTTLAAATFDAGRIDLTWIDNAGDELGFVIERCTGTGCTGFTAIDSVEAANATTFSNSGLAAATTYRYRVRAYNASGVSGASNVATAGTNVPAAPTALTATTISATRIDISWTDNADNEGAYRAERCTGLGCTDFAVIATLPIGSVSYSDLTTVVNTSYRYRVRATNNAGPSEYSDIVLVDTDVPATPTALGTTTISATRIDLSWGDASDNEVSFRVERCAGAGCSDFAEIATLPEASTVYADEPLTPNESYSYRVRAVNAAGASAYSTTQTATTSIPADPSALVATTISANRIDLSWNDNSGNELSFVVQRCADPSCLSGFDVSVSVGADVTSYSDETVGIGNLYYYRVAAQNAAGVSGPATASGSTLVPADPVSQTIVITAPDRITITWNDASNNEDGFVVERCRGVDCTDFSPLASLGADVTTYDDERLDVGTAYSYQVRATNAAGSSAPSTVMALVLSPPDAASKLNAVTLSATQIALSWQDNSANETGFQIELCRGAGCSDFALAATVAADVTTYQVDDLEFDTSYSFRIVAVNPVGAASPSDEAVTTTSLAAPASSLSATTVAPSQINLGWADNASTEAGYRIERCIGSACTDFIEIAVIGADATGYADPGLSLNTVYVYRVRPFNAVGPSAYSNEATANTLLPADPSNVTATAITVNRIDLTWTDNSDNESIFILETCQGAGCTNFTPVVGIPENATSYSFTSAVANTVYRARIRAFRSNVGSSGYTTTGDVSTVLNEPSFLRAQTVLRNRVDLTWSDNSDIETSYQVLFCAGAGCTPSSLVANLGANVTSYQHVGLSQNQNYSWRVRAVSNSTVAASLAAAGAYTPVSMGSGSVASGITDTLGAERYYVISVPAGTPELRITMTGGTGEADLHVRFGAAPTTSTFDCRPYPIGNEESCIIPNPAAGDWYFMPQAYQAIANVSVKSSLSTRYGFPTAFTGTSSWSPNYLIGQQLFVSQTITLSHIGLVVESGTGGVRIGLYTNNGGIPGSLITQVSGFISTTGLVEFAAPAVGVAAGTYWLMYNFQNPITRFQSTSSSTVNYINFTYGPSLPANYPNLPNSVFFPNGYFSYAGSVTNAHVRGYP